MTRPRRTLENPWAAELSIADRVLSAGGGEGVGEQSEALGVGGVWHSGLGASDADRTVLAGAGNDGGAEELIPVGGRDGKRCTMARMPSSRALATRPWRSGGGGGGGRG
jgi:hypothetical protein